MHRLQQRTPRATTACPEPDFAISMWHVPCRRMACVVVTAPDRRARPGVCASAAVCHPCNLPAALCAGGCRLWHPAARASADVPAGTSAPLNLATCAPHA